MFKIPKIKISRSSAIRLSAFACALILLMIFLPRPGQAKLSYELNRPWTSAQLLAPYDFPIYRDADEKEMLTDSVKRHFIPVFTIDETPVNSIAAAISSSDKFSESQKRLLTNTISRIYQPGIVEAETANLIYSGELSKLRISQEDGSTTMISTEGFRSPRRAYLLVDSLIKTVDPSLMHNLEGLGFYSMLNPNFIKDNDASTRLLNELLQPIEAAVGMVQKNEKIIDRGEPVTIDVIRKLHSLERAQAERKELSTTSSSFNVGLGQLLYISVLLVALYFFLYLYRPQYLKSQQRTVCLLTILVGMAIFAVVMNATFSAGLYVVPFAILPILVVVFYDTSTALFLLLIETLICATMASFVLEFIFLQINAGIVAVFSIKELARRSQLLRTALLIFLSYVVTYAAVELMQVASLNTFSWRLIGAFAINMVLISFAYILIFILEKIFGFTSVVTLVELADINNPLLQKLSEECPGTFQHSMAVSNLAADAARRINANVQLVRAGALYHDIGKTANPAFFTENQHGMNPHSQLDPRQSAQIIIRHVTNGASMADKAKLPKVIRDLILQHHGLSTARYFLTTWQNSHPGEETDMAPFTYPGPNPQTAEASLLMMADVVEAASRSLPDHTPEALRSLVNRLIDAQVNEGYHKDSPLSFRDISTIKEAFIERLRTMYHVRIAYPERKN